MKQETKKSGLLLFGKSIFPQGFKYRLYFADENTLNSDHPRLYQIACLRRKTFTGCSLGKVYDVSCRSKILKTMSEAGSIEIPEGVYQNLLKQREGLSRRPPSPFFRSLTVNPHYLEFKELKQIMAFKPQRIKEFCCGGLCTLLHFISLMIPFLLFVYSAVYYYMQFLPSKFWHARYYLLLPAYYYFSIPFMIYLMNLFYLLSDRLLLHYAAFKDILIQKEVYKNGGLRVCMALSRKQKSRLILYGIITGGIYLIFWLFMLL